ncbi:PCMD domain-containing protein [Chryseobacterium sp. LC2016-27]|uniref:PCMD domain-containing protein n=1 Tax=Chryseobacterium sp. LC2016-27 TaxID=2897326 RepID=UPI001E56510C|nr:PCMD domain-containing protein [Chryseobacterium sp. LC2016-27]MCD0456910.1 PCMD domain-containing protein [Chryseobacterium sp. LC2016-27]
MKKLLFFFSLSFFLISCISDPPLNPEADIEEFNVNENLLSSKTVINQTNKKIYLYLKPDAYQNGITPTIKVSNGAHIFPESGKLINFNEKVFYTVTSESGENSKIYEVEIVEIGTWNFNFENWAINPDNKYEFPLDNNIELWSSGNLGVALSGVPKQVDSYPTRSTANGLNGTIAAEMTTLPGNALSQLLNIHIFPGSIFLGNFNSSQALVNPLAATEFGQPYYKLPAKFTGYYRYTPGSTFWDNNGDPVVGETDKFALYAVLFNGPERLNGTNIDTSDKIIARAIVPNDINSTEFKKFEIPFTYIPGKIPGNNLMVAIIGTSSYQGGQYRGAVGSKLAIDNLRIIAQ